MYYSRIHVVVVFFKKNRALEILWIERGTARVLNLPLEDRYHHASVGQEWGTKFTPTDSEGSMTEGVRRNYEEAE
eukprot:SAG31_NODE_3121_length_4653_cov_61.162934_3_plen_75_part_00